MKQLFPQFAQTTPQGGPQQQDAEECWRGIMSTLQQEESGQGAPKTAAGDSKTAANLRELFEITVSSTLQCGEANEAPTQSEEHLTMLQCNVNQEISHLVEGLRQGLQTTLTKRSPTLNRDAIYSKKSVITRLPHYLTVQFVRFWWNPTKKVTSPSFPSSFQSPTF